MTTLFKGQLYIQRVYYNVYMYICVCIYIYIYIYIYVYMGFPDGSDSKESACNAGDPDLIPRLGRSHGEGMAAHSSIFAWRIPCTE